MEDLSKVDLHRPDRWQRGVYNCEFPHKFGDGSVIREGDEMYAVDAVVNEYSISMVCFMMTPDGTYRYFMVPAGSFLPTPGRAETVSPETAA